MAYRDDLTISVTDLSLSFAASTSAITMSKEKMFECDGKSLIFVCNWHYYSIMLESSVNKEKMA
jgi:hypothetical protein